MMATPPEPAADKPAVAGTFHRRIVAFHQDELGHWVADLECGHGQHMRHDPPWTSRPWVLQDDTRNAVLGTTLVCRRCERGE
jgi:hypothetical protein